MSALKILLHFLVRDSVKLDGPIWALDPQRTIIREDHPRPRPVVAQQAAAFLLAAAESRRSPNLIAGGI